MGNVSIVNQARAKQAMQWDQVVAAVHTAGWGQTTLGVATLAELVGMGWMASRGDEPLVDYLALNGAALVRLEGFGKTKVERLIEIVTKALTVWTEAEPVAVEAAGVLALDSESSVDPRAALREWGVELTWPLRQVVLPVRILHFCGEREITDIGGLLDLWESLGYYGLLAFRNLGKGSVGKLREFVRALRSGDRTVVARYLPLNDGGLGLSLRKAVQFVVEQLPASERQLLEHRLTGEMTLEESGERSGVTRERVRQVERDFLTSIKESLAWFSHEHASMLKDWMNEQNWLGVLRPFANPNDEALITAAVESIFQETPQGVARRMQTESEHEGWLEAMLDHADLYLEGVKLAEFLDEQVPHDSHGDFCESLMRCRRLRLDQATRLIQPSQPSARKTVQALLDREDDPIPLTWLIRLLNALPLYADWGSEQIVRNKGKWKKEDVAFAHEKILWAE